jgi:cytochrome P450
LEVDPPEHTEYRRIVEPFFKRPNEPEYIERVNGLIGRMLGEALGLGRVEMVKDFAVPLQSRALTYLMNMPESEAEIWIGWGTHVFRVGAGEKKGAALADYIDEQIDRAYENPGDDFFSALTRETYLGRPLTRVEIAGFANIMFAGGRDTVINSITGIVHYLGEHPDALEALRHNAKLVVSAGEEFVRWLSPVTHIGRQCPTDTNVHGVEVKAGERISLCFASANHDETIFESPEELRLDRKPNAHVGFGSGPHFCLGAPHARLIIRTLLRQLSEHVQKITIHDEKRNEPSESEYLRQVGFKSLLVSFEQRLKERR